MDYEQTKIQLKKALPQYLEMIGVSTTKPFTCLNPDHDDHNPSMIFNARDGQHVKCFSCNAYWDIFDLIAINELGASVEGKEVKYNFEEAYNKAMQVMGIQGPKMTINGKQEQAKTELGNISKANQAIINQANKLLDSAKFNALHTNSEQQRSHERGLEYLQRRGISENLASRFNLGFLNDWKSPTAIAHGNNPQGTPRLIIPTGKDSYIARDSRVDIPESEKRYAKMKEGRVHIFNEQALSSNAPTFIVEGEIDALSIMETGKAQAVALGSVANVNIFIKSVLKAQKKRKGNFYPTFLIALDNDEPGQRTINMLTTQLDRIKGVECYVVQIARGRKDANDALLADKAQFIKDIETAIKDPANRLQGLLDYINHNEEVQAISTGFQNLDAVLDGGLYEGLYGIGAISSLGKTTFALQIADHIAQIEQKPVLYFALEMGTYEMMTKSISRITFQNSGGNDDLAQGTRSLLKGRWKERYNKIQYENVLESFKEYGDYYSNVIIHDGSEKRPDIDDIANKVNSYVARTGKKPVVIIDYLQILKPVNERATDKANVTTSVNGMKKIATKYHIPVLVISSFNRMNYQNSVTMEAFKESGDIEYSTDVLIGLQLQGVGKEGFDVNAAKKENPRSVEAVILKNRNGATGDTLHYAYYSMFNKFLDIDSAMAEARQNKGIYPVTQVDADGRVSNPEK